MGMKYCEHCEKTIDLDFNSEHFDDKGRCIKGVEWAKLELARMSNELSELLGEDVEIRIDGNKENKKEDLHKD